MHPRFSVALDPARDLVTIVLSGLLLPSDVAEFFEARSAVHRGLRCPHGQHVTLTDLRGMHIMPQETVDAFAILLTDPQSLSHRLAFVASPSLVRSQTLRALAGRESRFFADMAAAEAWLTEDVGSTARANSGIWPPGVPASGRDIASHA